MSHDHMWQTEVHWSWQLNIASSLLSPKNSVNGYGSNLFQPVYKNHCLRFHTKSPIQPFPIVHTIIAFVLSSFQVTCWRRPWNSMLAPEASMASDAAWGLSARWRAAAGTPRSSSASGAWPVPPGPRANGTRTIRKRPKKEEKERGRFWKNIPLFIFYFERCLKDSKIWNSKMWRHGLMLGGVKQNCWKYRLCESSVQTSTRIHAWVEPPPDLENERRKSKSKRLSILVPNRSSTIDDMHVLGSNPTPFKRVLIHQESDHENTVLRCDPDIAPCQKKPAAVSWPTWTKSFRGSSWVSGAAIGTTSQATLLSPLRTKILTVP